MSGTPSSRSIRSFDLLVEDERSPIIIRAAVKGLPSVVVNMDLTPYGCQAIISAMLAGGDKGGADQGRFYRRLIAKADSRFERYLVALKPASSSKKAKERSHGKKS